MKQYQKIKQQIARIEQHIQENRLHPLRIYLANDQVKVTVSSLDAIEKSIGFLYIDSHGSCTLFKRE